MELRQIAATATYKDVPSVVKTVQREGMMIKIVNCEGRGRLYRGRHGCSSFAHWIYRASVPQNFHWDRPPFQRQSFCFRFVLVTFLTTFRAQSVVSLFGRRVILHLSAASLRAAGISWTCGFLLELDRSNRYPFLVILFREIFYVTSRGKTLALLNLLLQLSFL